MKTIKEFLESKSSSASHPMYEAKGERKIYFNSLPALFIYDMEMRGQVSDGHWENARPMNHWKWVTDTEIVFDKNHTPGYTGLTHQKKYDTSWINSHVRNAVKGKKDDWEWTIRCFNYAKFGSICPENEWKKFVDVYAARSIIEYLPKEEVDAEGLEKAYLSGPDYRKKYWDQAGKLFTDAILKDFYASKFDYADFTEANESCAESMNTNTTE